MRNREYIGDGVYAAFDGYQIVLTTFDGITETNTICLDSSTFVALLSYQIRLKDNLINDAIQQART